MEIRCVCRTCGEPLGSEPGGVWDRVVELRVDRCDGCHDDLGAERDAMTMRLAETEAEAEALRDENRELHHHLVELARKSTTEDLYWRQGNLSNAYLREELRRRDEEGR